VVSSVVIEVVCLFNIFLLLLQFSKLCNKHDALNGPAGIQVRIPVTPDAAACSFRQCDHHVPCGRGRWRTARSVAIGELQTTLR
jgi:hypothetical protein